MELTAPILIITISFMMIIKSDSHIQDIYLLPI